MIDGLFPWNSLIVCWVRSVLIGEPDCGYASVDLIEHRIRHHTVYDEFIDKPWRDGTESRPRDMNFVGVDSLWGASGV